MLGDPGQQQRESAEDPGGPEDDRQDEQAGDQVAQAGQPGDQHDDADDTGQDVPGDAAAGRQEGRDDPGQTAGDQPDAGEDRHRLQRDVRPDQDGESQGHREQAGDQQRPPRERLRAEFGGRVGPPRCGVGHAVRLGDPGWPGITRSG
ncbi:hypothetical protein Axi01nite_46060 [Actinoplanes xinjiangensis]|nr:hypothetical protein Axi01nite_46060 [Actinoplanes xinjiangensis]